MLLRWLSRFALTQAVELPLYAWALRPDVPSLRRRLALAFLATALTHPWVWFILPAALQQPLGWWGYFAVAELFAWLAEAWLLVLCGAPRRTALLASLMANAASAAVGMTLWAFKLG